MNIKPTIKKNKTNGKWISSYVSKSGKEYSVESKSPTIALKSWYKKFSKILKLDGG